ncbi:type VI secretion system ATPase TssH [Aestuariibacter salexigens]|uniref:type VI secretion system ATPase TssH n=1 Tax=Aestuariibacter salexigens TaxID=226010 RepID=UPI000407A295|nr:type VI secretion system ATPase TssH [Aestuariibacter salexigens]
MEKITLKSFVTRLNPVCTQALEGAAGLCVSNGSYEITVEHFLLKLLEDENDLALVLAHFNINIVKFVKHLQDAVERGVGENKQKPVFSKTLIGLLEDAWLVSSLELGATKIRSGALVLAILANTRRHGLSEYVDDLSDISYDDLKASFNDIVVDSKETAFEVSAASSGTAKASAAASAGDNEFLQKYCVNFTEQAREGRIDPVFCRDREIRQMVDILARRRKNNPICVGEAGVGKTSVVEGLALKVVEGDVPDMLKNVDIIGLDLSLLQAGASVKGEFENRLNGVINAVKSSPKPIILFIDEAHTLIGAGGAAGSGDAANLLKPALARGELRTIAATTWSEYKKYFEKDPALARRFQLVKLDEPTPEQAVVIIRGLRKIYEKAHGVYVRDDAVVAAAEMSARYINGRQLPDKAVDVLDTAAARVKISIGAKPERLDYLEREVKTLEREHDAILRDVNADVITEHELDELNETIAEKNGEIHGLTERWEKEVSLAQEILSLRQQLAALDEEPVEDDEQESSDEPSLSAEEIKIKIAELKGELTELQGDDPLVHYEVSPSVVGEVISNWTGIPVGKMVKNEAAAVLSFADNLKQRIKGQNHAIDAIDQGIRASKAGINNPDTPIGVFLFVGPSGVGKTETCIGVADLLFGGERYLTSVNMSEFQEKHSVSRLIGSPPGYVGFGEGGMLTEAVRQKPYSVVLLDEVEKADLEVLNLFYQVFDKGVLSDGEGQLVDFKNTVMFLTSNLATDVITDMCVNAETLPTVEEITEAIRPILSAHFKPALLARMKIVPFYPIGQDVMGDIVKLKLNKVKGRLKDSQNLELVYGDDVIEAIAARCTEVETGARNVDHIINGALLPMIATDILEKMEDEQEFSTLTLSMTDDGEFATQFS